MEFNPDIKKKRVGVRRETADRLIKELLQRVEIMNASTDKYAFPYKVKRLILFGSYLTDKPVLGDIDVFYEFQSNWEDKDFEEKQEYFRKLYYKETSAHRYWAEDYCYDYIKTQKYIKNRSKSLSIHQMSEYDEFKKEFPNFLYREIYNLEATNK
jgi:predicted nucleotidyltransferase